MPTLPFVSSACDWPNNEGIVYNSYEWENSTVWDCFFDWIEKDWINILICSEGDNCEIEWWYYQNEAMFVAYIDLIMLIQSNMNRPGRLTSKQRHSEFISMQTNST